jgi:hypothetical protein
MDAPDLQVVKAKVLAWTLCAFAVAFGVAATWLASLNGTGTANQAVILTQIVAAIVGAIVASRLPRAATGWILLGVGLLSGVGWILWEYGFRALVFGPGWLPFGPLAFALGSWIWIPAAGAGLPALLVRLPDGHLAPRWRWVDPTAVLGSAAVMFSIAAMPGPFDPRARLANPYALTGAEAWLVGLRWVGYGLVAVAIAGSLASLLVRMRHARGDEREQIKWITSSAALIAAALLYGLVRQVLGEPLFEALTPFFVSTVALPVAIGIAVLKYRLYDIDLVINRTLVYGGLTAMLAGLYAFWVGLTQRLVAFSGQRSDLVILLTAFVGAAAFTPVKNWLQKTVDKRFAVRDPASVVESMREQIEVIVNVLDARRIARRLVDDAVNTYQARSASLFLGANGETVPFHTRGDPSAKTALRIVLHSEGRELGVLSLAERRGGAVYTPRDLRVLQLYADAVAEAMDLSDAALGPKLQTPAD